jgi:hypothetical protein
MNFTVHERVYGNLPRVQKKLKHSVDVIFPAIDPFNVLTLKDCDILKNSHTYLSGSHFPDAAVVIKNESDIDYVVGVGPKKLGLGSSFEEKLAVMEEREKAYKKLLQQKWEELLVHTCNVCRKVHKFRGRARSDRSSKRIHANV